MVTCSDDIYIFLSGDIYIIWTSRNGIFFAKLRRRKGLIIFMLFPVFVLFVFHGRFRTRKLPY